MRPIRDVHCPHCDRVGLYHPSGSDDVECCHCGHLMTEAELERLLMEMAAYQTAKAKGKTA